MSSILTPAAKEVIEMIKYDKDKVCIVFTVNGKEYRTTGHAPDTFITIKRNEEMIGSGSGNEKSI